MAEFAANAALSATTGISPFHVVYWYEPRMDCDILAETDSPPLDPSKHQAPGGGPGNVAQGDLGGPQGDYTDITSTGQLTGKREA